MFRRTLIKNALPVTLAKAPLAPGLHQILIEDGRIAAIGPDLGVTEAAVIDAQGGIVMPGLIDTHRHTWQSLLRAQLADGTLYDYMAKLRYGFAPHFTAEDARLGNYAGALDALNSGVTTVVDHSHLVATPEHADALLTGLEEAGIRAVFCYGLSDVADAGKPIESTRAFMSTWRHQDAERLRNQRLSSKDGLIRFGLAGSEFMFAPLPYTEKEVRLARHLDAHRFSIHVANGPFARGTRYVSRLLQRGLVDERTLFVHGNVLTRQDLSLIREKGAAITITPESEMQMGMGTPVWPLAMEMGVTCGLGADIVSGGSGDLFTQMRLALVAGRLAANDRLGKCRVMPERLPLTAEDALRAVTIEGARAAGLESEVGSLEVGKRADLVLLRTCSAGLAPVLDPVKTIVMQAGVNDVEMVMVNGQVLKAKGALLACDEAALALRLQKTAERIVQVASDLGFEDAYTYMRAAFPLDRKSAFAARFVGWALRMPVLDEAVFKIMLSQLDATLKPKAASNG